MNDTAWIAPLLAGARPRAMAALLRYFGDLDTAEEAFQEASLRALERWPQAGPPRDALAWLILVGRNAALDTLRRHGAHLPLSEELPEADADRAQERQAEAHDAAPYRDDLLRLLFVCCHPALPATQQIALALRVVSGLTVAEIARAFLVGERAMEQRITRAKRRIAEEGIAFATPGAAERRERLAAVLATLYLLFNEGYSASGRAALLRAPLCEEAIRLARLLVLLFPEEPEVAGLTALMLLQHARAAARQNEDGALVLLAEQDRGRWDHAAIAEAQRMLQAALRRRRPGPYQLQAAIAATHARAARAQDTDWAEIERLYAALQALQPSPVVRLNRAVAVAEARGPMAALALVEPLAAPLADYMHFHGVRGALLLRAGRPQQARAAYDRAVALAGNLAQAEHLRAQAERIALPAPPAGRARPIA